MTRVQKSFRAKIAKIEGDRRYVFGTAYTSIDRARVVIDSDGDHVDPRELESTAHAFIEASRQLKTRHRGRTSGTVVESIVLDPEKATSMGFSSGDVAWWVGARIDDPTTWERVQSGELAEFSFGGEADRVAFSPPANALRAPGAPEAATTLKGLVVAELSLVPTGAGHKVPIVLRKEQDVDILKILKFRPELIKEEDRAKVLAALDDATRARVEKAEVLTLADVEAQLPEELWHVVLQAIAAAGMPAEDPAPAPPAEPPPPPKEEEEDPDKAGDAHHPKEEEEEEMTKERKEAAKLRQKVESLEKSLDEERYQRSFEAEKARVTKEFSDLPIDANHLTEVMVALRTVQKSAEATPVILSKAASAALLQFLESSGRILKESRLLNRSGSSRVGRDDAPSERLDKAAKEIQAKNESWSMAKCRIEAVKANPALYKAEAHMSARGRMEEL